MSSRVAIVVVAYNRPLSLARLLTSLQHCGLPDNVDIVISVDGGAPADVIAVSDAFTWRHGNIVRLHHDINMGLKAHILYVGSLTSRWPAIIVLEDDLTAHGNFIDYCLQAINFSDANPECAGVSLYSPLHNETSNARFEPVVAGSDTYLMQLPSSWGQLWTRQQWDAFFSWLQADGASNSSVILPPNIELWSDRSWKKLFTKYLITTGRFFLYPYVGYTTNHADPGDHIRRATHLFQGRLRYGGSPRIHFTPPERAVRYDAWGELHTEYLSRELSLPAPEMDLSQQKPLRLLDRASHVITSRSFHAGAVRTFDLSYYPLELNVLLNNTAPSGPLSVYEHPSGLDMVTSAHNLSEIIAGHYRVGSRRSTLALALRSFAGWPRRKRSRS